MALSPQPSAQTDTEWGNELDSYFYGLDPLFMDDQGQLDGGDSAFFSPSPFTSPTPFVEEPNSVQDVYEARKEEKETKQEKEQVIPKKRREDRVDSRATKVFFEGKYVTFGALIKRDFRYIDTNEKVSSAEKNKMNIVDGKAYFGDRQLIWNTKYRTDPLHPLFTRRLMLDGKEITKDAFFKRNYIFEGSGVKVTHTELIMCEFLSDGLYVKGKKIVWAPGQLKRKREAISDSSSDERQAKKSRTSPEGSHHDEPSSPVGSPQLTQRPTPSMQNQEYPRTSYPDTMFSAKSQQQTTPAASESQYTSKFLLQLGNVRGLR